MSSLPPITGTMHAVQQPNAAGQTGPRQTYLGTARSLLCGVRPLADAGRDAANALAFLAAHVAECALKAYLSRAGDDKPLKASKIRHNLKALWHRAHSEGLAIDANPPAWLLNLAELHDSPFFLRYSTGVNGLLLPAAEPMATELAALVGLVAKQ